jgi:hypothetical protein
MRVEESTTPEMVFQSMFLARRNEKNSPSWRWCSKHESSNEQWVFHSISIMAKVVILSKHFSVADTTKVH